MGNYSKLESQRHYCIDKDKMWIMPYDGRCPNCNHNILEDYTEKECETKLITGCKCCGRSLLS